MVQIFRVNDAPNLFSAAGGIRCIPVSFPTLERGK
jgi:hypothetical protein